jgi:hypothetical protein
MFSSRFSRVGGLAVLFGSLTFSVMAQEPAPSLDLQKLKPIPSKAPHCNPNSCCGPICPFSPPSNVEIIMSREDLTRILKEIGDAHNRAVDKLNQ